MKDLKEIHDKPNDSYGLGRKRRQDQAHEAVWIASFVDEGQRALQLVKAVEDPNGFDA